MFDYNFIFFVDIGMVEKWKEETTAENVHCFIYYWRYFKELLVIRIDRSYYYMSKKSIHVLVFSNFIL